MNKIEVEDILISMKTHDNEETINKLLNKVKTIDEVSIQKAIMQAGGTKEAITRFFESKISEKQNNTVQKHTSINEFFSYGIASNCVHLHLPTDLHSMIANQGISRTIDTVNMYLLDAIDKIKELKENGYDEFQGKDSIYMISPILLGREIKFLKELDFETRTYKKKELNNEDFLMNSLEAQFATQIFGKDKNVGIAQISFDFISSNEWQTKKEEKLKEFANKEITLITQKKELSRKVNAKEIEKQEKIGEGKCANIYRNGSTVYKILKEKSDSKRFYSKEMLQQLAGVKSDLCRFPNEILEDNNGKLLGYSMDFVSGRKMKDIISMLPFEQLQSVITKAEQDVEEISEQGIIFEDMHDDNVMWNEETQKIQIIDTDFFKRTEDNLNLNNTNYRRFSGVIQYMIDSKINQYGKTENEELIPFYNLANLKTKNGKQLSINEYITNLKSIIENDFGRQFNNLNEIEEVLKEKQYEFEEIQHLEQVANNLTIKEKFVRFLVQSKYIRKLPFINKIIDRQIKMLPTDVQKVVNQPIVDTIQKQVQEVKDTDKKRKFIQDLRNWTPNMTQGLQNPKEDRMTSNLKENNNYDDMEL